MKVSTSLKAHHRDVWIQSPPGRIFARIWSVSEPNGKQENVAPPIVLFHDSLGCIVFGVAFLPGSVKVREEV